MPVNNDARKMPFITNENAEHYYDELLSLYHYETDYIYNKVPFLKNLVEHHILREVTNIDEFKIHFPGEPLGQWKWLFDRKEVIVNFVTEGHIPQDLISGIEYLIKARNQAEHRQEMNKADFLGHFSLVARTINKFSGVPIPQEIQDILDDKKDKKDSPDSKRKKDKKDVPNMTKKPETKVCGVSFINVKDKEKDACLKKLIKDVGACECKNCLLSSIRVLGNGCIPSKVMFIAQNPGDFLGGMLLALDKVGGNFQELLDHIGWQRESIFITNAVLCHTVEDPTPTQIRNCNNYLKCLIDIVEPSVIVTLGKPAFNAINNIPPTKFKPANYRLGDIVTQSINWDKKIIFPLHNPSGQTIAAHRSMEQLIEDFEKLACIVKGLK